MELYDAAFKLKEHIPLVILSEVIFEVVVVVVAAKNICFKVNWIDRVTKEIHKERELYELLQNSKQ